MTQKEFIAILNREKYSYGIEEDKVIVTHRGDVYLSSLTSIPPGVVFKNRGHVELNSIIGGEFDDWNGNIEGIDSKRLLNLMISKGIFDRG